MKIHPAVQKLWGFFYLLSCHTKITLIFRSDLICQESEVAQDQKILITFEPLDGFSIFKKQFHLEFNLEDIWRSKLFVSVINKKYTKLINKFLFTYETKKMRVRNETGFILKPVMSWIQWTPFEVISWSSKSPNLRSKKIYW